MLGFLKLRNILLGVLCCLIFALPAESKTIGWGIPKGENNQQPWPGEEFDTIIRQNDSYYIGPPDEKVVYLTFDCGYENGNMPKILDALKEYNVPALFFLTGHFMEQCPDLVKRMAEEGHIVGNHTYYHPNLTKVSKERFNRELKLAEDKYYEITGNEMVRFLRPPEGNFNQQMLDWAREKGYYTIMWSLAYVDWDIKRQKGEDYAYDQVVARVHPGAIILLHSTSSDNADCLDELIPKLQDEGYEFKSIQYLMTRDLPNPIN